MGAGSQKRLKKSAATKRKETKSEVRELLIDKEKPKSSLYLNKSNQEISDKETQEMLNKMKAMTDEVQRKTQKLFAAFEKLTGLSQTDFQNFVDNPNNFTDAEWTQLNSIKKEEEEKMRKLLTELGIDPKEEMEKKTTEQAKKTQRKKSIKRKGWMKIE